MQNSPFSLDYFYHHYPVLNDFAVNQFQFLTAAWNMFLVLAPLFFYWLLKKHWRRTKLAGWREKIIAFILLVLWLLFFPNAAYIITDVRHLLNYCPPDSLNQVCLENGWMIIFFFVYANFGWISFYYLLKLMASLIEEIFNKFWSNIFVVCLVPLAALGVLLGLLNRFNSWDIFFYPLMLRQTIWFYFSQLNYFFNWFVFSIFLYLLYLAGDVIFRKIRS